MVAVDGAEFAFGGCPFVPDADAVVLKVFYVCLAFDEPKEFVDDGFEVELLGGEHWEAFAEVEAHLMAEDAAGSGAGAVRAINPFGHYSLKKVEILFHFWLF